ncbi:hypothetical protein Peur_013487 [Populus x canadensis]
MVGCWSKRDRSLQRRGEARGSCSGGLCHWTTTVLGGTKRKEEKRGGLPGVGRGQLALLLTGDKDVGGDAADE